MLTLIKGLIPCRRCDGQLRGEDAPCLHCGWMPWSGAEPTPVGKDLPETRDARLADNGCEFAPSCFDCPLPACKYELQVA